MVDAVQEVVRLRAAFDANACIPKLTDFVAEFFFFLRIADNDFRTETLCKLRRRHTADPKTDYQNFLIRQIHSNRLTFYDYNAFFIYMTSCIGFS